MAEEGRCDREPMRGGVFQPHRGQRGTLHGGGGYFQVTGMDVGPVRQGLASSPTEFR